MSPNDSNQCQSICKQEGTCTHTDYLRQDVTREQYAGHKATIGVLIATHVHRECDEMWEPRTAHCHTHADAHSR